MRKDIFGAVRKQKGLLTETATKMFSVCAMHSPESCQDIEPAVNKLRDRLSMDTHM